MKINAIIFNFISFVGMAQIIDTSYISKYDSLNDYYVFKKNIYAEGSLVIKPNVFKMSENLDLVMLRSKTDELNKTHNKYIQTLNGVPIKGTEFSVHSNENKISETANGWMLDEIFVDTSPQLDASSAITTAISIDGSDVFAWQVSSYENDLKERLKNENATYYPTAELIITNVDRSEPNYKLAYKIRIYAVSPAHTYDYYIDAMNGELISKSMISASNCHVNVEKIEFKNTSNKTQGVSPDYSVYRSGCNDAGCQSGTADIKFYQSQTIMTDYFTYGILCRYRTKNTCSSTYMYVRQLGGGDYRNNGNTWGNNYPSATTALWCIERTNDFYTNTFGRNSFDNNYAQIDVYPEDPNYAGNAVWTGSDMHIGTQAAPFSDELTTLDVIGHEFTHGVTQYEANLLYQGESGALNESFSDIFGIMIEFYGKQNFTTGLTPNYQIGEEVISGGIRDMSWPNNVNHPDTYNGTHWINPSSPVDNGGVHTNSGVQNYWFYLLSEGGNGTNDNNSPYCVKGIGRTKAGQIAYRNLTVYLNSNSNFANARAYSIQSAIDLFGANSEEVAQTTAAWHAVGVGSNYSGVIEIKNHTALSIENYNYNNPVKMQNFISTGSSIVTVTSASEIDLVPDVSINQGAIFHAFIQPACSGGARSADMSDLQNYNSSGEIGSDKNKTDMKKDQEFQVIPNPSNGIFKVILNTDKEYPTSITVNTILGNILYVNKSPKTFEINIDITSVPNGMYIIKVNYSDKIISRRIIKN